MGRVIGIDYGVKRLGLAIADPLLLFSQPYGTFTPDEAIPILQRLDTEEGIDVIVMGWPLKEDGSEGRSTDRVGEYINRLKKKFKRAEFVKQDERFSSERAKELIKQSERPSLKRSGRGRIDTAAACIILQEYLEDVSSTLLP